jgi:hypothetical protein
LLTDDGERLVFRPTAKDEASAVDEELLSNGVPALKKSKVRTWCFSIETMMKGCWQVVFQQREENERLLITVFQQREKLKQLLMVFQQRKGKGETSAGMSCFGNENDGEMAIKIVRLECFGSGKK